MRNTYKSIMSGFSLVLAQGVGVPVFAYDMNDAIKIYAESLLDQKVEVVANQQEAQQAHTREYYQKKWLENQAKTSQVALSKDNSQPTQTAQATPEADDLFLAATNGNNGQIGNLLAQGLDINIANAERETALHMAAARGHYSTVIFLIRNGAYTNARTIKNWIPLHHAVRFSHPNIVNYLIKRGSSAGVRTSDGLSAIDMAKNVNDYRLLSILGAR